MKKYLEYLKVFLKDGDKIDTIYDTDECMERLRIVNEYFESQDDNMHLFYAEDALEFYEYFTGTYMEGPVFFRVAELIKMPGILSYGCTMRDMGIEGIKNAQYDALGEVGQNCANALADDIWDMPGRRHIGIFFDHGVNEQITLPVKVRPEIYADRFKLLRDCIASAIFKGADIFVFFSENWDDASRCAYVSMYECSRGHIDGVGGNIAVEEAKSHYSKVDFPLYAGHVVDFTDCFDINEDLYEDRGFLG